MRGFARPGLGRPGRRARLTSLVVTVCFAVLLAPAGLGAVFTVNQTGDDSDGTCDAVTCTLREAIAAANTLAGPDQIFFNLPLGNPTVSLNSALPSLTNQLTIDGTTQPGYPSTKVVVDGSSAGPANNGLVISSSGNVITGLVITGFTNRNVWVTQPGNTLSASFVGTDAAGTTTITPPLFGSVTVQGGGGNTIGGATVADGNVIAGGLTIFGATTGGTTVRNNRIGVDATGTLALAGAALLVDQAPTTSILDNVVASIDVQSASGTDIRRNRIGTNAAGTAALVNAPSANGIQLLLAPDTTIGAAGEGNVVSGKAGDGIRIQDSTGVVVKGNRIGTSTDGLAAIPNSGDGILTTAVDTPPSATIGGIADGDGNTIAHNAGAGVAVFESAPTGIVIRGNAIYGNGGAEIDLGSDGPTDNDAGDVDDGPNGFQNKPTVETATQSGSGAGLLTVGISLSGKLGTVYSLDVYAGPSCGTREWIGTTDIQTAPDDPTKIRVAGSGSYVSTLSLGYTSNDGAPEFASATVTGPEGTSELSGCSAIVGAPPPEGSIAIVRTAAPQPNLHAGNDIDLTAAGSEDWAVWGYAAGGTSTSLAPDARKASGSGISDLTQINPNAVPLRGLGQYTPASEPDPVYHPFTFSWTDGDTADGVTEPAGLQHNGSDIGASTLDSGFSFTVPADTAPRTVRVYVSLNRAQGTLTATLSDGSAPQQVDSYGTEAPVSDFVGAVYEISYRALSAGETLTVEWVETQDFCTDFRCDNVAIHAVALGSPAPSFVVDSTNDVIDENPGDGICNTDVGDNCTLRAAIEEANAAAGPSTITFQIPPGGSQTIALDSVLPDVADTTTIDGTTQGGFTGVPLIRIDGSGAGSGGSFRIGTGATGSVVRGLSLTGFLGDAIAIEASGTTLEANYVGLASDGTTVAGSQGNGVRVVGSDVVLTNNVIVGSTDYGVFVDGAIGTQIVGNRIGILPGGGAAGNSIGVSIGSPSVGGTSRVEISENAIAFNSGLGIDVRGDGVTENSVPGPVDRENFPVVLTAESAGPSSTTVTGTYTDRSLLPAQTVRIEVFRSDTCDASGNGEGQEYLASQEFVTNADGTADWAITVPRALGALGGSVLTGTAFQPGVASNHSTSEFSDCLAVAAVAPPVGSVDLSVDDATPEAGAAQVRLDAVPPAAILDASRIVASPLADTPLADTPLADTPLADIPLADIGFADVASQLGTIPLSTLPLLRDGGWPAVLAGTDLAAKQLQEITLADVYGLVPLPAVLDGGTDDITLADLDLTNSALGRLNTLDVVLGTTPLAQVAVPDATPDADPGALDAWCELLAAPPVSCSAPTDLTGATILSTALRGAPLADTPLADTPLSDIPLSDIPLADTPLSDTPLADIPLSDTGVTGIPLADTPLSDIPLADIPLADIPLSDTPLADTPLADTPLADTPLADIDLERFPLSDTPLADVPLSDTPLADTPLSDTPLSDIDVARFPLSDTPLADVPLSDTPLADIPLADVAFPGTIFAGACTAPTVGDCTLLPGLDYGDVLSALSPSARILVADLVAAFEAAGALGPADTLGALLASYTPSTPIPVAALIRAFADTNPTALNGITLGELLHSLAIPLYGAFLALPEFEDLLDPTSAEYLDGLTVEELILIAGRENYTLADLLALLIQSDTLGWERLDLQQARVQEVSSAGGEVEFTARIGLSSVPGGSTAPTRTSVAVTLPAGFSYVPGSSSHGPDGAPVPVADPAVAGQVLTWTLTLGVDADFQNLVFRVKPGLRLGPATTSAAVTPTGGVAATDSEQVDVGDTFETNDTSGDAEPVDTSSFYLSYLTSASDVDLFTIPVPATPGTRTTFRLSHLPVDYDLVVYGPGGQVLRPSVSGTPPLDGAPLADDGASLTHTSDGLAPQPLDDVPIEESLPVVGISTLRGTQDDAVVVVSDGQPGNYTVQVSGYNGASSDGSYMLRVDEAAPASVPGCQPRTLAFPATRAGSLVLGTVPNGVNTVFLVNRAQLTGLYTDGANAIDAVSAQLVGFEAAGYPSAILQVDADNGVNAAMNAWNACPGSAGLANDAVREVGRVLDDFRGQHPTVTNVVIVGADPVIPQARLDDLVTVSNEAGYAATFDPASEPGAALAAGKVLSDDPYADVDPVPFLNRQLHVPDLALGRLVETPSDIARQVARFTAFDGELDPQTALTTGYDFLTDSAGEIAATLEARVGAGNATVLNDDAWSKNDLVGAFVPSAGGPPSVTSLNGHASHNAFGPALPTSAPFRVGDLPGVVTGDVQAFDRRLVFSVGCHSGFSVADVVVPTAVNATDWAESYARLGGTYLGNTGYGYGDTDVSAYSEELARIFAANAVEGTMTVGEAIVYAKHEHFGGLGVVSVYDEKASAEMTLYGLPMWKLPGAGAQAAAANGPQLLSLAAPQPLVAGIAQVAAVTAAAAASITDPATGLQAEPFDVDPAFSLVTPPSGRGSYLRGDDGVQVTHLRPIQPKTVVPLAVTDAHGALITELESADTRPFDPVFARPLVDSAAIEPELAYDDVAFPSKIQTLTTLKTPAGTRQRLVLVTGQFFSDGTLDEDGEGVQRRFTTIGGLVYRSASTTDFAPATFERVDAVKAGDVVSFGVQLDESAATIKRVLIGYLEEGATVWTFVDLVVDPDDATGRTWNRAIQTGAARIQYFVQSVDEHGNVGVTTNKATFFAGAEPVPPAPGGVSAVLTSASPPVDGTYVGAVQVGAEAPEGVTARVSVDDGDFTDPPVTVVEDGVHTVVVEGTDGSRAETAFVIDTKGPVISVIGPPGGTSGPATEIAFAVSEPGTFTCTLDGEAFTPCESPAALLGLPDGSHTFTVQGEDGLGNEGLPASTTWIVDLQPPDTTITASPPLVSASASASFEFGSSEPGSGFECELDGGGFSACTSPIGYSGLGEGEHTFQVRASDGPGNVDPSPASYEWTVDTIAPDTSITERPTDPSNDTAPGFSFSSPEAGGTFECKLDGEAAFTSCTSPRDHTGLTDGPHSFAVRAIDAAGNVDQSPASFTWTIDTAAPVVTLTGGPAEGSVVNVGTAGFGFSANETATFACSVDGGEFAACTSPAGLSGLQDGTHTFQVRGTDPAGNAGVSALRTWIVDATGPSITISAPTSGASYALGASVTADYACTDAGAPALTCLGAITSGPTGLGPRPSGTSLPTGQTGTYTLTVTSTDTAGNTATATATYTVGTLAGAIAFARGGKIWVVKPDGAGAFAARQLTQLAGLDQAGNWIDEQPSVSPDGRRVLFARRASPSAKSQLWVIDAAGRNAKQLIVDTAWDYTAPDWAPGGSQVAFESTRTGSKGRDIWTAAFSTAGGGTLSSPVNRSNANGDDVTPDWGPAGLRIVFATNRHHSQFEIYTMRANGSDQRRLTNDPRTDIEPTFSPTGALIAFSSNRAGGSGGFELYAMGGANGNAQIRLTVSPGVDGQPHFVAPLSLVFASARTTAAGAGLYAMAPSAVPPVKLAGTSAGDQQPG